MTAISWFRHVALFSLTLGLQTLCAQDVPTSLAWDVAAAPRHAALGGLDVAPLEADGWSVAVHPCALDSTVERDLYTSYLDFFAGIRAGAVTWPLAQPWQARVPRGHPFFDVRDIRRHHRRRTRIWKFLWRRLHRPVRYLLGLGFAMDFGGHRVDRFFGNLAQINAGVLAADLAALRRTRTAWAPLASW